MEPHPGHWIFAREIIGIIWLVMVPEKCQRSCCHHLPFDLPWRALVLETLAYFSPRDQAFTGKEGGPNAYMDSCSASMIAAVMQSIPVRTGPFATGDMLGTSRAKLKPILPQRET
jgi:hypothetical protein